MSNVWSRKKEILKSFETADHVPAQNKSVSWSDIFSWEKAVYIITDDILIGKIH